MIVRSVDGNNDWNMGKGRNDYRRDVDALAQNVKCRLQCFLGDCYFNLSGGLDWFNLLGSKNLLKLRLDISAVILNTYGVSKITRLEITPNEDREFLIQYSLDTIYGEINDQTEGLNA